MQNYEHHVIMEDCMYNHEIFWVFLLLYAKMAQDSKVMFNKPHGLPVLACGKWASW